jgi:hypothetical protein
MKRQPTAARLLHDRAVEVYDQSGNYLYRVHVGPYRATSAFVNGDALTVSLSDGRVQVFSLMPGQNPILRYTR